jgi:hypothetical protein
VGYAMKPCCGYCAEERQTREGMPFCDCRLVDRICERHTPPVAAEADVWACVEYRVEGGLYCEKPSGHNGPHRFKRKVGQPAASEAQGGADVNHACPVHGWEHDYRCCPLSDMAAVERFVAEVRERSRRRQVEVETDHAMRPGSLERFEVDGITGEAFDEVCSERNIK